MSAWQPMATAPKDARVKVDIWAKTWNPRSDTFYFQRFPGCWWDEGDHMTNRGPSWRHVDAGWYPTHWMPIADGPSEVQ